MSTLKVGAIRGVSASSDAITVANDGTCTANVTNNLTNRNLVINGAMQVAQRGTSSTANGSHVADRFKLNFSGTDESPTFEQVDVAGGTTPYTSGFRKAIRITNGDQTSGAGAADLIKLNYIFEAQDIAQSGWNYLSEASFITIQFWVKSSIAQNFFFRLTTTDGTAQSYVMETGTLTADAWTKITKTVPGNSNLQFDNNSDNGFLWEFIPFRGTNTTGTRPLNAWAAFDGSTRCPDMTSNWYTTNNSTLEFTGVQLEVGSVATDFEHKSFAQDLALCQRYYFRLAEGADHVPICMGSAYTSTINIGIVHFPCKMRANPSVAAVNSSNYYRIISNGSTFFGSNVVIEDANSTCTGIRVTGASGVSQGTASYIRLGNALAYVAFDAEL
tara:strand:+ start:711 stop:1871 length:1161 start_codon:yes stop_codon:yes gene_type:complete